MALNKIGFAVAGCAVMGLASIGHVQAQQAWSYDYDEINRPGNGPRNSSVAQLLEDFEFHYAKNGVEEGFSASIKFKPEVTQDVPGGFWLAVSDSENPKGNVREYAILYGDLITNRISAYEYSGANGPNSFSNPGNLIEIFEMPMAIDQVTGQVDFTLDVTTINNFLDTDDWDGIGFGDNPNRPNEIGVWFHFSDSLNVKYDSNQRLTKFNLHPDGYVDFQKKRATPKDCSDLPPDFPGCTTEVAEPGSLALLGLGLTGLAVTRRRYAKT